MKPAFNLQPSLIGELIELRPLTPADFDALFAVASDARIWEQHPDSNRFEREIFERYFAGALESGGAFAIIDRTSGRIIGSSRYCNLKDAEPEVEIGWTFLERAYWGGTYNRELKQLMLDHAFAQPGPSGTGQIERVIFVVGENNIRSRKAMEKIGASFVRKVRLPGSGGTLRSNVVYAVTRQIKNE